MNLAVLGAQWGDEGKGKIVDLLTPRFAFVARYQGGHNAGHTVFVEGRKFVLHLIPSGILHAGVTCLIGNGVVVDPEALFQEVDGLAAHGIDAAGRLVRAKVPSTPLDPSRAILDGLRELGAGPGAAVIHGTTVGTNALLERKLPRTVLVTTAGFRDVLEIARQDRPRLYDLFAISYG